MKKCSMKEIDILGHVPYVPHFLKKTIILISGNIKIIQVIFGRQSLTTWQWHWTQSSSWIIHENNEALFLEAMFCVSTAFLKLSTLLRKVELALQHKNKVWKHNYYCVYRGWLKWAPLHPHCLLGSFAHLVVQAVVLEFRGVRYSGAVNTL